MNKLLKEIEKQATRRIETKVRKGGWDNDREPYEYKTVADIFFDKEKFAELIVRECAAVISKENEGEFETHTDWGDGYSAGLDTAKTAIQEHFGVKE